ncbi:uncharacterized protein LOC114801889 [Denticeps clupeoides]|uniref:uncharacterized protein LOC114801889 n=1 Tax=Denticeps clupeoides TaxID=299321 RepID=UPI0010A33428|nr:uncharacterized protein LOC114801889 [Denticeps clupeoides]
MKLVIIASLIGTLLNTALALQCFFCEDPRDPGCTSQKLVTCDAGQVCTTNTSTPQGSASNIKRFSISITITINFRSNNVNAGGHNFIVNKGCLNESLCGLDDYQSPSQMSLNLGYRNFTSTSSCCNSTGCNETPLPSPVVKLTNGLQCESCTDEHDQVCSTVLPCVGTEDHCVDDSVVALSGQNVTLRGCASGKVCEVNHLRCCEGRLCNSNRVSPVNAAGQFAVVGRLPLLWCLMLIVSQSMQINA